MSYSRFGFGSNVYVYSDGVDLHCCGYILKDDYVTASRAGMLKHLKDHADHGHKVPFYAIEQLEDEVEKYGDLAVNDEYSLEIPNQNAVSSV